MFNMHSAGYELKLKFYMYLTKKGHKHDLITWLVFVTRDLFNKLGHSF